jgi:hypothetical protein
MKDSDLDFWIKNNLNVLFIGRHGVGKTSIIVDAFNRNNLKWAYFSAPTMDPWVDFVGVPKERVDDNGLIYLDLVRPKQFANDEIEAIYFDEFNRAAKKIKNASMEMLQFKSINGKKFNNLKIIWAAINPDDDDELEYDVEKLDPAQKDRFHIICELPYKPDITYFTKKYNEHGSAAVDWWNKLPKEVQKEISPRRLDYALHVHCLGGNIRNSLPKQANASQLLSILSIGDINAKLNTLAKSSPEEIRSFLSNINNVTLVIDNIAKNNDYMKLFLPYINADKLVSLMNSSNKIKNYIFSNYIDFKNLIYTISQTTSPLQKEAKKLVEQNTATIPAGPLNIDLSNLSISGSVDIYLTARKKCRVNFINNEILVPTKTCQEYNWQSSSYKQGQTSTYNRIIMLSIISKYMPCDLTMQMNNEIYNDLTKIIRSTNISTFNGSFKNKIDIIQVQKAINYLLSIRIKNSLDITILIKNLITRRYYYIFKNLIVDIEHAVRI